MLPSVSGGIGHISRSAALARALWRIDQRTEVEFVLDTERLRPFNIEATMQMGFRPRFLPPRTRDSRHAIARVCLGGADVIVDDVARYLLPLRQAVPEAAWVSILMHPVRDELFDDWPCMAQMDGLIWPYAPVMGLPAELAPFEDRILHTGPFLEIGDVPQRAEARRQIGLQDGEQAVVYAPRGFPFGPEFGHRVLGSLFDAVEALRSGRHPGLRLFLLAVKDPAELRAAGLPKELPDWVVVEGVVTPDRSLLYGRAADVLIAEGTSTMHEGAALRTPLLLIPGPIQEAMLLAGRLAEAKAARLLKIASVSAETLAAALVALLDRSAPTEAMLDSAATLITGGGGADAAARLVVDTAARHKLAGNTPVRQPLPQLMRLASVRA